MNKKFVAIFLVIAMAISSVFASSITLTSPLGNAKLYNETYKSVNTADSANENWIVRTSDKEVSFEKDGLNLTIGENSLVQFTSLDSETPIVYLLDGWIIAETAEGVKLTINTTVTNYSVVENSSIVVISNTTTENGYVEQGNASVTNTITGVNNNLEAGAYLDLSQSNSQPQSPAEDSEVLVITSRKKAEAEIEAQPVTEQEQPVETAESSEAVEEAPVAETAQTTEPEQPAEAEQSAEQEQPTEPVEEAPVAETEQTTEPEQPAEEAETVVLGPLTHTFSFAGYNAKVTAYIGEALVEYPAFVTAQELYAAASAAYNAYSQYLKDVYVQVVEDGKAVVTYPETYGIEEFNFAVSLVEKELPYYLSALFGEEYEPEVEAEVKTDDKEAVVIEITAQETPAPKAEPVEEPVEGPAEEPQPEVEETVETTTTETTTEEPAPVETEVAQTPTVQITEVKEKKNTNVRFGATIGAIYGQYTEGSEVKSLVSRIGFAPKNVLINVDPYITVGNFTFGLHLSVNPMDIKNSFNFNTSNGATGYISSIAKYLGRINFNSDILKINIDRTHSVEFSSPVFFTLDRAFDKNNSLVATGSLELGFLTISAFIDDLQLTNHLNGKTQYAGISLTAGSQYVTVNTSVIAKAKNLKEIDLYPAIDATATIDAGKLDIDFYAGFASLYKNSSSSTKNFLGKGKITLSSKIFSFGFGIAYNQGLHINDAVSNTNLTVENPAAGNFIDVLVSGGLHWGVLSIDGAMSIPLSIQEGAEGLVYNEVKTASGSTKNITADVMKLSGKLDFNHVVLSGGILYQGFSGKINDVITAINNNTGVNSSLKALVDTDLATVFAQMDIKLGGFDAYLRGDLAHLEGKAMVAATVGASFTF